MASTLRSERAMLAGSTLTRKEGSGRALMLSTAIFSGNGVSRANGVASRLNTNRATICQAYGRISRQSRQVFELTLCILSILRHDYRRNRYLTPNWTVLAGAAELPRPKNGELNTPTMLLML